MDAKCLLEWRDMYSVYVDGPQTLFCDGCGMTVHGDGPEIGIECLCCFRARKDKEDARPES